VTIAGADLGTDSLVINGLGGNDVINASALKPGLVNLTINGGDGDDVIHRQRRRRHRHRRPRQRHGIARQWQTTPSSGTPGDGSDVVEGQGGIDTLVFNGANVSEKHRPLGQRHAAAAFP